MILDRLSNSSLFERIHPGIRRAFEFIHSSNPESLQPGRHEIDGDRLYAMVSGYRTKSADRKAWEAHRLYIDLQVMVQGAERICYAPLSRLTPGTYDEAKDFLRLLGEGDSVTLPEGSFMLLWPGDGHMPCLAVGEPEPIKKVVVKIAVE